MTFLLLAIKKITSLYYWHYCRMLVVFFLLEKRLLIYMYVIKARFTSVKNSSNPVTRTDDIYLFIFVGIHIFEGLQT